MSESAKRAIRIRMYIGGLKSMFAGVHESLEEIEKQGIITKRLISELLDIRDAIGTTLDEVQKAQTNCCEHDDHKYCDDEEDGEDDGISDDEDGDYDDEEEEVTKPRRKHEED